MRLPVPGHGASRGSALGRARVRLPHVLDVGEQRIDDVDSELDRLHAAIHVVRGEMRALGQRPPGALARRARSLQPADSGAVWEMACRVGCGCGGLGRPG